MPSIESHLLGLIQTIHNSRPNHPMFGPLEKGLIRAPCKSPRANGICWINIVKRIANLNYLHPISIANNNCWMSKTTNIQITRQVKGQTEVLVTFKTVRFLQFLRFPTDDQWKTFINGGIYEPFDHFCGRGEATDPRQLGYCCINGLKHGEFSTRKDNESRKSCKNGAKALCPGHGIWEEKCLFTHPDGIIKPCLNEDSQVPKCKCQRKCYPWIHILQPIHIWCGSCQSLVRCDQALRADILFSQGISTYLKQSSVCGLPIALRALQRSGHLPRLATGLA